MFGINILFVVSQYFLIGKLLFYLPEEICIFYIKKQLKNDHKVELKSNDRYKITRACTVWLLLTCYGIVSIRTTVTRQNGTQKDQNLSKIWDKLKCHMIKIKTFIILQACGSGLWAPWPLTLVAVCTVPVGSHFWLRKTSSQCLHGWQGYPIWRLPWHWCGSPGKLRGQPQSSPAVLCGHIHVPSLQLLGKAPICPAKTCRCVGLLVEEGKSGEKTLIVCAHVSWETGQVSCCMLSSCTMKVKQESGCRLYPGLGRARRLRSSLPYFSPNVCSHSDPESLLLGVRRLEGLDFC